MLLLSSMPFTLSPPPLPCIITTAATPSNTQCCISLLKRRTPVSHANQIHAHTFRTPPVHPKHDALLVFTEMLRQGEVLPDHRTFSFLLMAFASLLDESAAKQVHNRILKLGFASDVRVNTGLIHCYASCGLLDSAWKVFDEMPVRNCISWSLFIGELVRLGEFEFALWMFVEMLEVCEPDGCTLRRIVSACVGLGALSMGMCVHGFLLKMRDPAVRTDLVLNNLIVELYCKCGMLTMAKQVFDRMINRDVESWNSLIQGFVMHGEVKMALDCFERMVKRDGFRPNSVTFLGVLSACKCKGMVDEGLDYFDMMLMDYEVHPQPEHYECLVDLCARGGFSDKATSLLSNMRLKPDVMPSNKETNGKEDEYTMSTKAADCPRVIFRPQTAKQDTYAPLVTALKSAAEDNAASFHFPGHNRGQAAPSPLTELIGKKPYVYDLPELPELDNLFAPEGPILDAQKQAAEVFGSTETWFLTGGTTCGIQAAIMATCSPGDTLILPRNCHISAISGVVLSGVIPKYIIPDYNSDWDIAGPVTPSQVNEAIKDLESEGRKPATVFVTSPTYYGMCSNLQQISELCSSKDIPLIVDEAHGAHFGFHPNLPFSALKQGADLAVQSTHKVLSSLTQSSMLHRSGQLVDRERISRCLQTLQSTSPSYLLLASLDAATAQLATNSESIFKNAIHLANEAKALIKRIPGLLVLDSGSLSELPMIDPLRVTVGVWELGLSGYEADEFIEKDQGVMCELVGSRSITFVFTPGTREDHVKRLILGLENLSTTFLPHGRLDRSVKHLETEPLGCSKMQLNPREAFFTRKRKVSLKESIGKISGELVCPYPPGIPVLIPGEVVTEKALDFIIEIKRQGGVITGASDPLLSSIVICDL